MIRRSPWARGYYAQVATRIAGDVDSELYRRTVAAVIRTAVLLTVLIAFCAGSWVV